MKSGDRVVHPEWGEGTIRKTLVFGRARVSFDAQPRLLRIVMRRELAPLEPVPEPLASPMVRRRRSRPESGLDRSEAWQTLEALRLGVVPAHGVKEYTVARAAELESVHDLLRAARGCRVIWGDYGAGKTHMLDAAEQLALEQGFATARLTLDPREQALHHPLRLYNKIVSSLRTNDRASRGFEGIFERLVDSVAHRDPKGERASRFFSPYLHALHVGGEEDLGWLRDYVRGDNIDAQEVNQVLSRLRWRGQRVLQLSDFRTYGRMYVHLVGNLASWCADAGTRGLVLLFDEVERVDALRPSDQHYAFEVLRHYAAVTMKTGDLGFDPEDLYKGGHEVHRRLPLRFRDDQPLAALFALTPLEEIEAEMGRLTESSAYDIRLGPLSRAHLPDLVHRIAAIYARAYPDFTPRAGFEEEIHAAIAEGVEEGHDSFRAAVRAAVFLIDAGRLGPAKP